MATSGRDFLAPIGCLCAAASARSLIQRIGRRGGLPPRRAGYPTGMRTVADAMTSPPVTVAPDTTIQAASAAMLDAHAHAAIVVEGGRVRGLVTVDDVARALAAGADTPVGAVAEPDPPVVHAQEPLAEAHERMRAAQRGALPVVANGGEPLGLLVDPGFSTGA